MKITSIESIVWATMIPTPGFFKCSINGCAETATKRVTIKDGPAVIRLCLCSGCLQRPVEEMLKGASEKINPGPGTHCNGAGHFVADEN